MRNRMDRTPGTRQAGWRQYQNRFQQLRSRQRIKIRLARGLLIAAAALAFGAGIWLLSGRTAPAPENTSAPAENPADLLAKADLQAAISAADLSNLRESGFQIILDQRPHLVQTSIQPPLQQMLMDRLDKRHSRYIGIVAMEPDSGRILAMVGYDKTGGSGNPCIESRFPAASIFKIVTAAAAIQELGLLPDSQLTYNGRKHTLYKSQLGTVQNRYTNRTTLRKSFAQSINPVFGKIGTHRLGRELLAKYAEAFGFNRQIEFEASLPASTFQITDEPYYWAELASGFNRDTRISPLHGALIASVVLNGGKLIEPSIVDRVTDPTGRVVYRTRSEKIREVISPAACRQLSDLMEATVGAGTLRRTFRDAGRDLVLSKLSIGAKTGSINSRKNGARYDWFVGYAREKEGDARFVLSAVVAHEEYIGVRAADYARLAIRQYFQDAFARRPSDRRDVPG